MKWPATLLFITGLVNPADCHGDVALSDGEVQCHRQFPPDCDAKTVDVRAVRPVHDRSDPDGVTAKLCLELRRHSDGASRMARIILGLPAGLGVSPTRPLGSRRGIQTPTTSDWRELELPAMPLTFGLELVRMLIIALMWLIAIAIPLVSYVLAQDSGAFQTSESTGKTIFSFAALAVVLGSPRR